jgi:protoheme IX farnesyltransferase
VSTALATSSRLRPLISDLVALTKPRVTALVMATAAVGMGMAPGRITLVKALAMFGTTALLVGSANALNCWLERDTDVFMQRTQKRPLPDRRLDPQLAFWFATVLALLSLPLLTLAINPITGLLGALSLWSYVWIYTPMKFRSPFAMVVGAVPGALPPLMGWTAVTGQIALGGVALFLIVFVWQMPHVIGLSMYRRAEYEKAGIRVLPLVRGPRVAQLHAIAWAALMLPASLAPVAFGLGGPWFIALASLLGAAYLGSTLLALTRRSESVDRWGRRVFFVSLLYLPLLLLALLLDKGA